MRIEISFATAYRVAIGVAVASALILVWINAAAGIIGDGPINLMYFGVIAVGMIGAFIARLEPRGMSRALFATSLPTPIGDLAQRDITAIHHRPPDCSQ